MSKLVNISKTSRSNTMKRSQVAVGEVFIVAKRKRGSTQTLYAHTGVRTTPPSPQPTMWQSMNLKSGDCASTAKGDKQVKVVGTYSFDVILHKDFEGLAANLK